MNNGSTLNAALSLIFLTFSLSGYETSGSGVGEAARWESRHLLQEAFNAEIQVYVEAEKNCTEPGRTGAVLWSKCETTPGVHHSYICQLVMGVRNGLDAGPAVQ